MDASEARRIADSIVADYGKGRTIDKLSLNSQPDKEAVIDIIEKLIGILYAGFFRDRGTKLYDARTGLSVMVEDCMFRLERQLVTVLPFGAQYASMPQEQLQEESRRITFAFFQRIPDIREMMDTDLQAFLDGDPAASSKEEIVYAYPGFFTISVHRLAHELFLLGVPMIPRIMSEYAHSQTGIDIHPGATIGRYFLMDHGTGIVIGETTVIGDHVKIYQGVTLGALSTRGGQALRGKKRHPTVENNVTIYANASVLGDTVVGHDSVIGGSVFITENVPAWTRVSLGNVDLTFRTKKD